MPPTIIVRRLSTRTFFKLCLIGNVFTLILVWAGLTISALAGAPLVAWEDEYITGKWTTIAGPVVLITGALLLCVIQTGFACLGLLFFSRFRNIRISYVAAVEHNSGS